MLASTASALEITWTLIAIISLGFTAWIVQDNLLNYAAVREAVRQGRAVTAGPRWWVALASLVSSTAMFVVWLGFATAGVLAMTVGPDTPLEQRVRVSEAVGWVLVAMTLILAGIQVWQVYARTKIRPITQAPNARTEAAIAVNEAAIAVDEAADQTQHAADLVNALRPIEDDTTERQP